MKREEYKIMVVLYMNRSITIREETSLKEFMDRVTGESDEFVVFINNVLIDRERYAQYKLNDHDHIVKVDFMPGG